MSRVYIANFSLNGKVSEPLHIPFHLVSKRLDTLQDKINQEFKENTPLIEWTHSIFAHRNLWTRRFKAPEGIWTAYIAENNLI